MVEYIEKEKAIKLCLKHHSDSFTDIPAHEATYALAVDINNIESAADVVKVVRCKKCQHYNTSCCADGFGWCERFNRGETNENFCSYGERRSENENT